MRSEEEVVKKSLYLVSNKLRSLGSDDIQSSSKPFVLLRRDPRYAEIIGNGIIVQADAASFPHGYLIGLNFGFSIHVSHSLIVKISSLHVLLDVAQLVNDIQI